MEQYYRTTPGVSSPNQWYLILRQLPLVVSVFRISFVELSITIYDKHHGKPIHGDHVLDGFSSRPLSYKYSAFHSTTNRLKLTGLPHDFYSRHGSQQIRHRRLKFSARNVHLQCYRSLTRRENSLTEYRLGFLVHLKFSLIASHFVLNFENHM